MFGLFKKFKDGLKKTAENALRSDDMNQWMDALLENVTVEQQSGISNVSKF